VNHETKYNQRLDFLNKVEEFVEKYSRKRKSVVPNLSGWSNDECFREAMSQAIFVPKSTTKTDILSYIYTYGIDEGIRNEIKYRLGCMDHNEIIIFPNNTISIVNTINYMAKIGLKNVIILSPYYFTIPELMENRNIKFDIIPLIHTDNGFRVPHEEITRKNYDSMIITSPIFTTGIYYSEEDIWFFEKYLKTGNYLIADESLAAPQHELVRRLGRYENFISIYSPHKFIHCNAMKFSVLVHSKSNHDFFERWNDYYSGSLGLSSLTAINHFLSENYAYATKTFFEIINKRKEMLKQLLTLYPSFYMDEKSTGGYCHIFNNTIKYKFLNSLPSIKTLVANTNTLVLPNILHGFLPAQGFGFRLNLSAFNTHAQTSLAMVLAYLNSIPT